MDLMDARTVGTTRRQRLLASGLQVAAAFLLFTGAATLFAVTLVDSDVLDYREGAAADVARWFVRMGETARVDPLTWYVPRILMLVGVVGLLALIAHRIERDEPPRRPFD
jgi:formate hydrogenlyase subunit 3/multisubunit Na+/H+ antiporter MnhD subunit